MDVIELEGGAWTTADDFYTAYFAAVGVPEWHGRNLDALWDSLTAGGINQLDPPFRIRIRGTVSMSFDVREMVRRFEALVQEAKRKAIGCKSNCCREGTPPSA